MKILYLSIDKIINRLTPNFLDEAAKEEYPLGKNTERYWIFKSDGNISSNGNREVELFNLLCRQANMNGYGSVMITKNPPN